MTAYRICRKCEVQKDTTNFYKNGNVCFDCKKPTSYNYGKTKPERKMRCCLMCDGQFASFGNRICSKCKKSWDDSVDSDSYTLIS